VQYAREHGYDTSLPIEKLQEEVFTTTASQIEHQNGGYTPEKVAQLKAAYVDVLQKVYFMGIAAQEVGISRKLVTTWLKTDLAFAEQVFEAQSLTAERVGVTLLAEGINKKDTTSLMFMIKQFGDVFQKPIQAGFDEMAEAVNPIGDISKLSLDEQQLLLHLLRKAKKSSDVPPPMSTAFDESDYDDGSDDDEQAVISSEAAGTPQETLDDPYSIPKSMYPSPPYFGTAVSIPANIPID